MEYIMKLLLSLIAVVLRCGGLGAGALRVGGAAVYGTELTPDGVQGKVPVVLLHAGSGRLIAMATTICCRARTTR
jgi:hypothetical protein